MGTYIARRLAWLPVILLIVSFITFVLGRFGPGDPVELRMGQYYNPESRGTAFGSNSGASTTTSFLQYGRYLKGVVQGDFGESFKLPGADRQ